MGRLVDIEDVKALINGLDSLPWEEEVDDLVKTIPTAYSVDAVVAEIKEANKNEVNAGVCPNGFVHCLTAIDIVKRGGVE